MDGVSSEALAACVEVRADRRWYKLLFVSFSTLIAVPIMWAISHHQSVIAALLVAAGVFGTVGVARKLKEDVSPWEMFNLKRGSWGFIAMGTLLPAAAYLEASIWPQLQSRGWLKFLPAHWYNQWYWWLIAGGIIVGYSVVFRKGEAKNYDDYLRFNSFGKLAHDFMAVPISFTIIAFGLVVVVLAGDWSHWPTLVAILVLVAVWVILGPVDLWRMSWSNSWGLSREKLHVQGSVRGLAWHPLLVGVPSATAFHTYLRDQRPGRKRPRKPG